ncbi:hypothetical protein [Aliarcobacter cryaerophilus]|uniref:hypothetical protein n=1 Tax=Aliarcobacter cryaerophilus TaxID=28198 RepID=UPI003DA48431
MAIKPNSYKLVCSKCCFSKIVAPKSDALSPKDLVAIAKADGEVDITEKLFIKEVAKSLDFDLNDLNLLFES